MNVRHDAQGWHVEDVWRNSRFKTRFSPPVIRDGLVYGLDEGTLACLEPLSGRRLCKEGRYGHGQILLAGESLLVLDEDGSLHLVSVNSDGPVEQASFVALDGLTMNPPAAAHGRLLVRNKREIACYRLAPGPDATSP